MAFDTPTRNRLSKFVDGCRELLTEEFTRQLTRDFGLNPQTGDVADIDGLQLDDAGRETAQVLRDTMQHYLAVSAGQPSDAQKEVLQRIVREQAFTVLNRLCALRMGESRELFIESVGSGIQSDGFQLYSRLAGNALGDTGETYRYFLFSVFDELAVDLPVLFDRFSEHGRLFPSESVLLQLLNEMNHQDLAHLWAEDETIGWIYQYFNTAEDRRLARYAPDGKPKAPQNSRELAIRNQFFTPRYVVEFLTDNTLGRIWYEMRKGETTLKDDCQYLVRRPHEIFLAEGEQAPERSEDEKRKDLTQEELLRQPVHIAHRPLKDPREIRMLDPACGSMHFGLYAFDLYLKIYEEYWDLLTSAPSIAIEPTDLPSLNEGYESRDAFLRDVPRLIIEHNIHGIDIDPRAVQIAGLSLWLRAQRAWKSQGIVPADRPAVTRSNAVCAEPMPGDKEQLEAFCQEMHPAIAQMVTAIFEEMKLAGEAGSLLKIEQEISLLVTKAKQQFQNNPPDKHTQMQLFGDSVSVKDQRLEFDLSGITNELFFLKAEEEIYETLRRYANQTTEGGFRKKLFANDAEMGFAFIELCSTTFDVVLMNPPFGSFVDNDSGFSKDNYSLCTEDIDSAFVSRGVTLLDSSGLLGIITNRSQWFKSMLATWRQVEFFAQRTITTAADLGFKILDAALVEAVAYCIANSKTNSHSQFFRLLKSEDKESDLRRMIDPAPHDEKFVLNFDELVAIPKKRIAYSASGGFLRAFSRNARIKDIGIQAYKGCFTGDNFRFIRLFWEVPPERIVAPTHGQHEAMGWVGYSKGGEYHPFYADLHLLIDWRHGGEDVVCTKGGGLRNPAKFFCAGLTYPERTTSGFCPQYLPAGFIFDSQGPLIAAETDTLALTACGFLLCRSVALMIEFMVSSGDAVSSGSAARHYTQGIINDLPVPEFFDDLANDLATRSKECWKLISISSLVDETQRPFVWPFAANSCVLNLSIAEIAESEFRTALSSYLQILEYTYEMDEMVQEAFSFSKSELAEIEEEIGPHPCSYPLDVHPNETRKPMDLVELSSGDLVELAVSELGASRALTKKTFFANRQIELVARICNKNPADVVADMVEAGAPVKYIEQVAKRVLSFAVGCAFLRWDFRNMPEGSGSRRTPLEPLEQRQACAFFGDGAAILDTAQLVEGVRSALVVLWKDRASEIESELCLVLSIESLVNYLDTMASFFAAHYETYSKSRREAPIYWPISTGSSSYTLWFYYHRLTDQTVYTAINDFVDPKLKQMHRQVADLRATDNRTSAQENELATLTELASELEQFKSDLLEIAAFWKPNLNDGVQITAAPLWKFFRLAKWRNKLKKTWEDLESGKYDWSHLALSIWPDRVVREKCTTDRSIAIAHDLEEELWHEVEVTSTTRGGRDTTKMEWQPKGLSEAELDTIVEEVKSR